MAIYALGYGNTGKQTLRDGTITNKMLNNDAEPDFFDQAVKGGRGAGVGSSW